MFLSADFFRKADNTTGFNKSGVMMKALAQEIVDAAVAGKVGAVHGSGPGFTGIQQLSCVSLSSIGSADINSLQISYRETVCSFYIVMTKLTLCEPDRG